MKPAFVALFPAPGERRGPPAECWPPADRWPPPRTPRTARRTTGRPPERRGPARGIAGRPPERRGPARGTLAAPQNAADRPAERWPPRGTLAPVERGPPADRWPPAAERRGPPGRTRERRGTPRPTPRTGARGRMTLESASFVTAARASERQAIGPRLSADRPPEPTNGRGAQTSFARRRSSAHRSPT